MGGLISLALRDCGLISFMICGVATEIGIDPIADFEAGGAAAIEADKMEAVLADFPTSKGGAWSNSRPFGPERFTAVPTGIGGCSPAILIPVGCSSGTSPIFPQVAKAPTLRSELFSSRLAMDQRSKNSCV
jgi:hypothetical protein